MKPEYVNNWHRVWSNRILPEEMDVGVLQRLISLDGFDSPLGFMQESDWNTYVNRFASRSNIKPGDTIFELGCGGGVFLYPFYVAGHDVGGIDYSSALIQIAQSVMPRRKGFLNAMEASGCPVNPMEDVVIANHVIHYFPSLEYSCVVIGLMLRKSSRVVSISGIPNADLRSESEKKRRGLLSLEEYDSKYCGLDILYYRKDSFVELASLHGFSASFFDHEMPGFAQNQFRYDCVMTKI